MLKRLLALALATGAVMATSARTAHAPGPDGPGAPAPDDQDSAPAEEPAEESRVLR